MSHLKENFKLDNFEGPLDHLYFLLGKNELDIYQIVLTELIEQFLKGSEDVREKDGLDRGAEFISMAATLCLFKSKTLLPKHQQEEELSDLDVDKNFEIIHHLIDYCRFKKAAKELAERELQQSAFYSRGVDPLTAKKNLGIDHLSLDDLNTLFQQILSKAVVKNGLIEEEEWKVSDKIDQLKERLKTHATLNFHDVFQSSFCRYELIVTFLALLELMKSGNVKVVVDNENNSVCIIRG